MVSGPVNEVLDVQQGDWYVRCRAVMDSPASPSKLFELMNMLLEAWEHMDDIGYEDNYLSIELLAGPSLVYNDCLVCGGSRLENSGTIIQIHYDNVNQVTDPKIEMCLHCGDELLSAISQSAYVADIYEIEHNVSSSSSSESESESESESN